MVMATKLVSCSCPAAVLWPQSVEDRSVIDCLLACLPAAGVLINKYGRHMNATVAGKIFGPVPQPKKQKETV